MTSPGTMKTGTMAASPGTCSNRTVLTVLGVTTLVIFLISLVYNNSDLLVRKEIVYVYVQCTGTPQIAAIHRNQTANQSDLVNKQGTTTTIPLSSTPAYRPALVAPAHSGEWTSFQEPFELYVYSAFYDDRISLGTLPVVRVISISEQNLESTPVLCLLEYGQVRDHYKVEATYLTIGMGIPHHNKYLREYVLSCQLPDTHIPTMLSILPTSETPPSFFIPVEAPMKPAVKAKFAVCVSVAFWSPDVRGIVEWMELLKILGVSQVSIYNNSLVPEASRIFQHYAKEKFVDFRQSHNMFEDSEVLTMEMHMSPVINDCMYRNMHRFNKIIVTDLDELIVPRKHMNYVDMLKAIDEVQADDHPARNYVFTNAYFFQDFPQSLDQPNLITLRNQWRLPYSGPGYAVKSIIDPQTCTNMHNHYCWGLTPLHDHPGDTVDVEVDLGLNQHYKKCHFDEWEHKPGYCKELMKEGIEDNGMLRFKDKLVPRVARQLKALKLGVI